MKWKPPWYPQWYQGFFDGLYGRVLSHTFDQSQTNQQVIMVKRFLGARPGQQVLDIPCGMGRLTIPLAQKGLKMTGVDLTESYLHKARREAISKGLDIRFIQSDMRAIDFEAEFHHAFNWFGSFGYFTDRENAAFAERVFRSLLPGGRFLLDGINRSWLLENFIERHEQRAGGVKVVTINRWDKKTCRINAEWEFSRGKTIEQRRSSLRIFNGTEIRALLHSAGFRHIELYGYPPLGRFNRHCRRFIAVGTRPTKS